MGDSVKYQIEKAREALRSALEHGAMHEDVWTLSQIASGLSTVEGLLSTTEQKEFTLKNPYYNGYVGGSGLTDDVITFK
jgi:hypothetical protein